MSIDATLYSNILMILVWGEGDWVPEMHHPIRNFFLMGVALPFPFKLAAAFGVFNMNAI